MTEEQLLLRGFSGQERSDFLAIGQEKRLGPDEELVRENMPGSSLYIVREGEVSVEKLGVTMSSLQGGDVLGELVIFRPSARSATVRALAPATVLEFEKDSIMTFFKRRQERLFKIFVINVINVLSRKLDRTDDRVVQLECQLNVE